MPTLPVPERYRAYTKGSLRAAHLVKTETDDGEGLGPKPAYDAENVAFSGDLTNGRAGFDAGKTVISKIVFYGGEPDGEVVVGSVEVGASGPQDVGL